MGTAVLLETRDTREISKTRKISETRVLVSVDDNFRMFEKHVDEWMKDSFSKTYT